MESLGLRISKSEVSRICQGLYEQVEAFCGAFLRGFVARGLLGVELAISDAHPGLKAAIA